MPEVGELVRDDVDLGAVADDERRVQKNCSRGLHAAVRERRRQNGEVEASPAIRTEEALGGRNHAAREVRRQPPLSPPALAPSRLRQGAHGHIECETSSDVPLGVLLELPVRGVDDARLCPDARALAQRPEHELAADDADQVARDGVVLGPGGRVDGAVDGRRGRVERGRDAQGREEDRERRVDGGGVGGLDGGRVEAGEERAGVNGLRAARERERWRGGRSAWEGR